MSVIGIIALSAGLLIALLCAMADQVVLSRFSERRESARPVQTPADVLRLAAGSTGGHEVRAA